MPDIQSRPFTERQFWPLDKRATYAVGIWAIAHGFWPIQIGSDFISKLNPDASLGVTARQTIGDIGVMVDIIIPDGRKFSWEFSRVEMDRTEDEIVGAMIGDVIIWQTAQA